jgi:hypothetical protein
MHCECYDTVKPTPSVPRTRCIAGRARVRMDGALVVAQETVRAERRPHPLKILNIKMIIRMIIITIKMI